MPTTLRRKYLNLCFSKIIPPLEADQSPSMRPTLSNSPSPHHHRSLPLPATNNSSSSSSSILIKNFNTLYEDSIAPTSSSLSRISTATSAFEPEHEPADFATAFASQRFFFSSPGRSNSIIESSNAECIPSSPSSSSSSKTKNQKLFIFNNSVAVPTYSPDPYLDFRQSMQEMVEARPELMDVKSNWEILHELLLCYLALNPKTTHNYIVSAFADLLVTLMSSSQPKPEELAAAGGGG